MVKQARIGVLMPCASLHRMSHSCYHSLWWAAACSPLLCSLLATEVQSTGEASGLPSTHFHIYKASHYSTCELLPLRHKQQTTNNKQQTTNTQPAHNRSSL